MSENYEFYSGEVTESTVYYPVPAGQYRFVVSLAEFVDPVALGWNPPDGASEQDTAEMQRPFPRFRCQIVADKDGGESEYKGRFVDLRIDLRNGINKKTGRSFAETRSDILRVKHGLGPKDEVTGLRFLPLNGLAGMSREEFVASATAAINAEYAGLEFVGRVIHIKNKRSGEPRESIGKVIVGAAS